MATLREDVLRDLRYASRSFRRAPGLALTAVLALALGIGSSTAVFSVVDRILFRSLPYGNPAELVSFGFVAPIEPEEFMLGTAYVQWKNSQSAFASMAAWAPGGQACDLTESSPERLTCALVERTLLPTLEVRPLLGRNFTKEEDRPHGARVVLISHALWRTRFASDPAIAGKTLSLEGQPSTIIGVLPADFEMPTLSPADILEPLALDLAAQVPPNSGRVLRVVGRLAPGVSAAQARAALQVASDSEQWVPKQFRSEVKFRVENLRDRQTGDYRVSSLTLLAAVIAVLLVACANIANLLLARAASRERESAIRTALGASRVRLGLQALVEGLALAIAGGIVGCGLAFALLRIFVRLAPQGIPHLQQATLDLRVLAFALLSSIACGVLFSLAPITSKPNREALSDGHSIQGSRNPMRQVLAAVQVAGSVLLLSAATLLLRSLWSLESVPLGLNTDHVVTATITLETHQYPTAKEQFAFYQSLEAKLRGLPGVESLALSDSLPPSGLMRSRPYSGLQLEGREPYREGTGGMIDWRAVTPEYFDVLGIPIVRGRGFEPQDRSPGRYSMVVSESLAKKMFGSRDPLGQRVRMIDGKEWYTIVGVAAGVKNGGITSAADPEYYVVRREVADDATARTSIILRTSLNPSATIKWVRGEIASLDATLPVDTETMDQRVGKLLARPRFNAVLLSIFGGMALLLAAIGVYSVMALLVTQRTQEIGVRMALGATRRGIAGLVLSSAAGWTLAGVIVGVLVSLAAARAFRTLLFGVPQFDPVAMGVSAAVLMVSAVLAAYVPARRAAMVDPIIALRHE